MNTQTLDLAFEALNASVQSIFEDDGAVKKGDALAKSIDQFIDHVTGDGFGTIVKEARGELIVKLIPGLTPEQSFLKAAEENPRAIERQYAPVSAPLAKNLVVAKSEAALQKAATELIKADRSLTKEQAIAKALENDPALYDVAERAKWGQGPQTE